VLLVDSKDFQLDLPEEIGFVILVLQCLLSLPAERLVFLPSPVGLGIKIHCAPLLAWERWSFAHSLLYLSFEVGDVEVEWKTNTLLLRVVTPLNFSEGLPIVLLVLDQLLLPCWVVCFGKYQWFGIESTHQSSIGTKFVQTCVLAESDLGLG
jgi:hypothetical protein